MNVRQAFLMAAVVLACAASSASGSGPMLHLLIGDEALDKLKSNELRTLLRQESDAYKMGLLFPDCLGLRDMVLGAEEGEHLHSPEFLNDYIDYIRNNPDSLPDGERDELKAHFFGTLGHILGDTNFDRYFLAAVGEHCPDIPQGKFRDDQFFTDVVLDPGAFETLPLSRKQSRARWDEVRPHENYVPAEVIAKLLDGHAEFGPRSSARVIKRGVRLAWLIVRTRPYPGRLRAALKINKAERQCPWGSEYKNWMNSKGGVDDSAAWLAGFFDSTWELLERDQAPVYSSPNWGWPNRDFCLSSNGVPVKGYPNDKVCSRTRKTSARGKKPEASGCGFKGAQQIEVLSISELAGAVQRMAGRKGKGRPALTDRFPDMEIQKLKFGDPAKADSRKETIAGELHMASKKGGAMVKLAAIDLDVGPDGFSGTGELKGFKLGPLTWKDATLDLRATPKESALVIRGGVELLGSTRDTELQLTRDGLSFTTSRHVVGLKGKPLWTTDLQVESAFDLKKPKWKVHGTLSQDFMDEYGPMLDGGVLDFVGPALAFGGDVLRRAESALNGIKQELHFIPGIDKTPLEKLANLIKLRRAHLEKKKKEKKAQVDAAYKTWQDALKKKKKAPVKKAKYRALKVTYDEGPMSVVKRYNRVNGRYQFVCEQSVRLKEAKWARKKKQDVLRKDLDAINSYSGKKVALSKAEFDADLEGWLNGAPVQLTLDLLYLGRPRQITLPWTFGKPAENAKNVKTIVAQLAPVEEFAQIKQEHNARVEAGIAECK